MPIATRTFRVFVSSTFEDLKEERDALQREVWPKLRTLCEQHGARFQAIDLRWGVRDEAALDQKTMEICLREIERCQRTGIRPNFIVLLGDRYGWLPLPSRIPVSELDPRVAAGDWYKLDENAVPAEYVLQPRAGIFTNPDIWSVIEELLQARLESAARAAGISGKALEKYVQSATHQEIAAGLGKGEADRQHVFGFFREPSPETDSRLGEVKALVPNYVEFSASRLDTLCDAVCDRLSSVIAEEIGRFEHADPLDVEIEAHNRFAAERARIFQGRKRELDAIEDYLLNDERRPLVLHGPSGSGKSAVMAKASLDHRGPARIIRRFVAATPDSVSGHALLTGLCRELAPGEETPVEFSKLERVFQERLAAAGPVVLFIDALDQLAAGDPACALFWVARELPPGVKVVVSTGPEAVQLHFGSPLTIEPMMVEEGGKALDDLLHEGGRTLLPWQRDKVLDGFARCGLPLYLKLVAEESRLWRSCSADAECRIGEGVAGMLDLLFERLAGPAGHGPILVDRGLGYLAAARYGLAEDEVLEVLAADDTVWQDFCRHKHHQVEGRQLPLVVWSRFRLDLDPYLTERMSPGGAVVAFYHRLLAERAAVNQEARHRDLVDYFQNRPAWLDRGKKHPNVRRSAELPFQQRALGDWDTAEATLFDADFLLAKAAAGLVQDLEADYGSVLAERPSAALRLIHEAVVLSMHVLATDPRQCASQMVGRLLGFPEVSRFVGKLSAVAPRPWIRPLHPCLDAPGGPLLCTLEGHFGWVGCIAITADGRRAVSASSHHTLRVWDLDNRRTLRTLEGHSDDVTGVAITPNGHWAVSASNDRTLKLWDLETGRTLRTLDGHSGYITGIAITPEGQRAVSASNDKTLKVWDLESGTELRTLGHSSAFANLAEEHSYTATALALTPDGKQVISGSFGGTLKVWDLESGRELRTMEGLGEPVAGIAVTPDGKQVVAASPCGIKVWDLESGRDLREWEGHRDSVTCVAVTPDGKQVVSASPHGTLTVWGLESGRDLRILEGHSDSVNAVVVTPDGKRVISASRDGTLKIWDLESGGELRRRECHSGAVYGVALTTNGEQAVSTGFRDFRLKVWDLDSGRTVNSLEEDVGSVFLAPLTPDGKRAFSGFHNAVKVWDVESGRELRSLEGHSGSVTSVAVTPDGKRLTSASWDGTLKVWDLDTGRELHTLEGHSDTVRGLAITPDGKRAVSASLDKTLKVWDLECGRELRTLEGHSDSVTSVAVTPDGKVAASACRDGTLKMWDLDTGRELRTIEGHSDSVTSVAVMPDGQCGVSTSYDNTLRVWDLETGTPIAFFNCDSAAWSCACGPPNRIVAGDGIGRVYFLALEE